MRNTGFWVGPGRAETNGALLCQLICLVNCPPSLYSKDPGEECLVLRSLVLLRLICTQPLFVRFAVWGGVCVGLLFPLHSESTPVRILICSLDAPFSAASFMASVCQNSLFSMHFC